jgi:hypothetical protein
MLKRSWHLTKPYTWSTLLTTLRVILTKLVFNYFRSLRQSIRLQIVVFLFRLNVHFIRDRINSLLVKKSPLNPN